MYEYVCRLKRFAMLTSRRPTVSHQFGITSTLVLPLERNLVLRFLSRSHVHTYIHTNCFVTPFAALSRPVYGPGRASIVLRVFCVYHHCHCHCLCLAAQDMDESVVMAKPNIWCHFAKGIGDPKYNEVSGTMCAHWIDAKRARLETALRQFVTSF